MRSAPSGFWYVKRAGICYRRFPAWFFRTRPHQCPRSLQRNLCRGPDIGVPLLFRWSQFFCYRPGCRLRTVER